ncbi:hypothetical protein J5N97_017251 [Dioscorea zingiberensis]|uniref:DUF7910 domain-containing protein n=1 Tax=Dioscorea zingiberensis TaxID=325984 RepID=A0A9D5HFY8_9LILI|nr:hypothetical protein J5N97_017251 [Dioscorea zingiberensis]
MDLVGDCAARSVGLGPEPDDSGLLLLLSGGLSREQRLSRRAQARFERATKAAASFPLPSALIGAGQAARSPPSSGNGVVGSLQSPAPSSLSVEHLEATPTEPPPCLNPASPMTVRKDFKGFNKKFPALPPHILRSSVDRHRRFEFGIALKKGALRAGSQVNGFSKVKGVNLGGWLVVEGWVKPSLFDGILNGDMLDGTKVQPMSVTLGKYVSAVNGGGMNVTMDRDIPSLWETFKVPQDV